MPLLPDIVLNAGDSPANRILKGGSVVYQHFLTTTFIANEAVAAYSLRKVNFNAVNAIRVRRSSDNAELDIGFTAEGGLDEVVLLSHVGANDGFVSVLYDQSGASIDLLQATLIKQPRIIIAGSIIRENGRPVLGFDGSNDTLTSIVSLASPAPQMFIFYVAKRNVASQSTTDFNLNSPSAGDPGRVTTHIPFSTIGIIWDPGSVTSDRLIAAGQNDVNVNQTTFTKIAGVNQQQIRKNGTLIAQRTQGTTSTTVGAITLGGFSDTEPGPANMNWQELLVFFTDKTDSVTDTETDQMDSLIN